jgi:hypothetical protein
MTIKYLTDLHKIDWMGALPCKPAALRITSILRPDQAEHRRDTHGHLPGGLEKIFLAESQRYGVTAWNHHPESAAHAEFDPYLRNSSQIEDLGLRLNS